MQYLNPLLCGFQQAHGTEHALFRMLQARQKELDKCWDSSNGFSESLQLSTP